MAAKDSVVVTNLSEKDKQDLVSRIKSSLARQLWRNEGFYEMLNTSDNTVKKAVEFLSK
jgi:carboxyl-terminal processing protease